MRKFIMRTSIKPCQNCYYDKIAVVIGWFGTYYGWCLHCGTDVKLIKVKREDKYPNVVKFKPKK